MTKLDSLGAAVTATAILGAVIVFGLLGLYWLLFGLVVIGVAAVVAPVFLIPLGLVLLVVMFFYVMFRRFAAKTPETTQDPQIQSRDVDDLNTR